MTKKPQSDVGPISVTISKKRDVAWLRSLVSRGVYASLNDAVVDLVEEARLRHPAVILVAYPVSE